MLEESEKVLDQLDIHIPGLTGVSRDVGWSAPGG